MPYIFLDESGDLGFDFSKKKNVVSICNYFLFVKSKDPIEKIVKKVFKSFSSLERAFHHGCFCTVTKRRPKYVTRSLI